MKGLAISLNKDGYSIESPLSKKKGGSPFGEADPMICSKCGGRMKVVAFITESVEYFYRPHMLFGLDCRIFRCQVGRFIGWSRNS